MNERKSLNGFSFKNQKAITLIALVISIIVMLILVGVSLNATVGENGIITKASQAKEIQELAQAKEDLEYMFFDYNIGDYDDIAVWLENKRRDGEIEDFKFWKNEGEDTFSYLITKNGTQFYVAKEGEYYYATQTQSNLDTIGAGITIVTQDSFDASTGNMSFELNDSEKATMYFAEEVSGEFNFEIKGGTVDIYITQDMNLTNAGLKRSAIDIYPNATLNLHIAEGKTLNVNSGFGEDANGNVAGKGGYAGIHVPWIDSNNNGIRDNGEFAILNLYGSGTLKAFGGKAGNGDIQSNSLQAGGGGAGAGIGGAGGSGGNGASGVGDDNYVRANNGKNGESCGNINIYNNLTVYAYGGAGGSGGIGLYGDGGGAGGYPAAGIGGGGAGGAGATCCTGAGGYSGGAGGGTIDSTIAYNGTSGEYSRRCTSYWGGGGYFSGQEGYDLNGIILKNTCFSGMGGTSWWRGHRAGNGGTAGEGGCIVTSDYSKIYSFNGNLYTDGTSYEDGRNQCPIYLQDGIITAKYDVLSYGSHASYKDWSYTNTELSNNITLTITQEQSTINKLAYNNLLYLDDTIFSTERYININELLNVIGNPLSNVDMSTQGIGSGAGYIEISNGTYTVDPSMN